MTKFHDQVLSYELKALLRRLEDPKVLETIYQHPSFKTQRLVARSLGKLIERVRYTLRKVENRRSWWTRLKRRWFPEEFDGRVASLMMETDEFLEKIGVGGDGVGGAGA